MSASTAQTPISRIARTVLYALTWLVMSAAITLMNKYILSSTSFRYIFALALAHMLVATLMCRGLFRLKPGLKQSSSSSNESPHLLLRFCVIAGLFAASLTSANAALARLDVASVQMIKAIHPAIIYFLGMSCGVEGPSWSISVCIAVICGGVMFAVQGAMTLEPIGVFLQVLALVADGARFLYLQATMQVCTGALDPINVLDRVAPIASAFLWAAGSIWEFPTMSLGRAELHAIIPLLLVSSILAFGLNLSSYAYIQATSALTMGVSGIFRDVLLIGISVTYFGASLTFYQCAGYAAAILGTLVYMKCRKDLQRTSENTSKTCQDHQHQAIAKTVIEFAKHAACHETQDDNVDVHALID